MNKILLALTILCVSFLSKAQTTVTYYDSKYREVPEKKARYIRTVTKNDGTITSKQTDLKTGDMNSETYKDYEPYGIWEVESRSPGIGKKIEKLDYNFPLVYSEDSCGKLYPPAQDVDDIGYKAPKLEGYPDVYMFLAKNAKYPAPAKENGIQGKVFVRFIVTKEGKVENISVVRSAHIVLDKEAARLIRKLEFSSPAMLQGKPIESCYILPVSFKLE